MPERDKLRPLHDPDWRRCGACGGRDTLSSYGTEWFSLLPLTRWGRLSAEDLEAARVLR